MYLCDLKNHPESIIRVENDSRYYDDESRYVYNKHFVNVHSSDLCFNGMIINNCSFNGFQFSAGFFKGCVIENCRFYNCTFDKNAFISCIIIGERNYLFGCHVSGFTYKGVTVSSNDLIYRSLHTLMHRLPDGFKNCRHIHYIDWSFIEHKRFYNKSIESRIVRYSRIKKAKELSYNVFVNVTFYKCDFTKYSPMGCIFINCIFVDCPYQTNNLRGCILCECKGGFDTTYSV